MDDKSVSLTDVVDVYIKKEIDSPDYEDSITLPDPFLVEANIKNEDAIEEKIDLSDVNFIEEEIDQANSHNRTINFHSVYIKEEIDLPDFEPEVKFEMEDEDEDDEEDVDESNEILSAKKVLFKCSQCQKTFKRKNGLIKHMEVHSGMNLYRCQECNKYFTQFRILLKHMQNIHKKEKPYHESALKKKPYQCYYCEKAFDLVSPLMKHEALHTGEEPFKCNKCQLSFRQKSELSDHRQDHHNEGISYKCEECSETFVKRIDWLRHMNDIKQGSSCKSLKKGAIVNSSKRSVNQPKKDFTCSKCGEVSISKYQLQEHLEVHAGIRPFQCKECKKAYKREVDLKNHTSLYHPKKGKKKLNCKCHLCGATFAYTSSLSRHHTKGRCQFYNNF